MRMYIILLAGLVGYVTSLTTVDVIASEKGIKGTCRGGCDSAGIQYNKEHCKKLYDCKKNTDGPLSGIYMCDLCRCKCDTEKKYGTKTTESMLTLNEEDIYNTCKNTCEKVGLVRTDFKGCDELRDCNKARTGHLKGYRCDFCNCKCIKKSQGESNTSGPDLKSLADHTDGGC